MSWLDYHPLTGMWREANGTADDAGGGVETADQMRNSDQFDYSWACGACDAPISDSDSVCGACGEPVEWDKPPIT